MTAMGVQVMGTTLNKCVSKGDDHWGLKWSLIPAALKVYALGDLNSVSAHTMCLQEY